MIRFWEFIAHRCPAAAELGRSAREGVTLDDVAQELDRRGIPESSYCLTGGLPNEAYTIERAAERWRVYYSERGCRSGVLEFTDEREACAALLREVLRAFPASAGE